MRVNVYAEELPEKGSVEIIGKEIDGHVFTGLRIPLYLPVTMPDGTQARGKFMHHPGDDDSSAITIWGKQDLRVILVEAYSKLNEHYLIQDLNKEIAEVKSQKVKEAAQLFIKADDVLRRVMFHATSFTSEQNAKGVIQHFMDLESTGELDSVIFDLKDNIENG